MDYQKAYIKFINAKSIKFNKKEIEHIIENKFQAIEIQLYSISKTDYTNDEDVNEQEIYKLYTITDPKVLNELFNKFEKTMFNEDLESQNEDYISLQSIKDKEDYIYTKLILEQNYGKRLSIVLESNKKDHISNFKVYGCSNYLNKYLVALIGLKNMDIGNLNDRNFQFYLECLEENNFL